MLLPSGSATVTSSVGAFGTSVALFVGETTAVTEGDKFGGRMRTFTTLDVAVSPEKSVATAVRALGPIGGLVQIRLNGTAKTDPMLVVPVKNSTLVTAPSASNALAMRVIGDCWNDEL